MEEHEEELEAWSREQKEDEPEIEIEFHAEQEEEEPTLLQEPPVTMTMVQIGGVDFTINAVATAMTTASMTVFKKEKRAALSEEQRA